MLARVRHRGPWQTQIHDGGYVNLGCCLLPSERDRAYAFANNKALAIDGHLYSSDEPGLPEAELALHLYNRFGHRFAGMLDGDFACAIADGDELVLLRDPIGLKPLYYGYRDGQFCFASEAKGLLDVADEVGEFPPGHIYATKTGFQPYASQVKPVPEFTGPEQAAEILAMLVKQAVQRRVQDNLARGVSLSGGLDSSVIAFLAKECRADIKTFTAGVAGSEDLPRAQEIAEYLGTEHHEYVYGAHEISEVLPQVIYYLESFDEDCVHGAVANYFAAQLIARHADCYLCGEGADEFLGGYHLLKEAKNDVEFHSITADLIANACRTGLQRLDRMAAAHSLEFRAPFLDRGVTDFCLKIPKEWKVYGPGKVEKWLLRQALSDKIPENIIQRRKAPFAKGAGAFTITESIAGKGISKEEYMAHRKTEGGMILKSEAELYYYRIFKDVFPHPSFEKLVTRWDPLQRCRGDNSGV